MDFLLECIGFPPDQDLEQLALEVRRRGEPTAWRGPAGLHMRLPLAEGLELRLDQDEGEAHASLWPHCQVPYRLRVRADSVQAIPDQPYDALLRGLANPPAPGFDSDPSESWPIAAFLTDARRLPRRFQAGRVLAVSAAGYALDVSHVGPDQPDGDPAQARTASGSRFALLGGEHDPGGCMELSVRVRSVRHIRNPITGAQVEMVQAEAPGRPLVLFLSRWQLEQDGLPSPRPGWRIEGSFVLTGRIAGGLPSAADGAAGPFG